MVHGGTREKVAYQGKANDSVAPTATISAAHMGSSLYNTLLMVSYHLEPHSYDTPEDIILKLCLWSFLSTLVLFLHLLFLSHGEVSSNPSTKDEKHLPKMKVIGAF